jgi:hypothetical protein
MSKGLGRVERLVLERLDVELGLFVHGRTVPDLRTALPEIAEPSLRRALRSLERKKLVQRVVRGRRGQDCDRWVAVAAIKRQAEQEREERRRKKAGCRNEQEWKEQEARTKRVKAALFGSVDPVDPMAETLAKVLGLLGSAHDGEVLAAALKAEEVRRRIGKTWGQLLGLE